MQIVDVKIEDLRAAEYNPRQMSKKQVDDLTKSIKEFGLVDPIIVNSNEARKNIIIGGHQRAKVARSMGFETVPVYYLDLSEDKERELNLRLNKNVGDWDWDLLANFDEDFLQNVGFDQKELEKKMKDNDEPVEGDYEFATELLEENNYIVFAFDNSLDWGNASETLGLKQVLFFNGGGENKSIARGVGHVLKGSILLNLINK
ncbi:MAG: hypothetical protein A3F67_04200 [Verrucomicrobia bacterium RIFCSPHIGHO2_12_FULL_41_10]|nr:MAG: hypothetical protein A3F67_04200 [Verrucomicrobia bacterium RIFCSPHIGHO2_12_FULL_41_10]HLB57752.1 ParB N-terminal domain-containing protein [Gammaproteobacteria bacterium]